MCSLTASIISKKCLLYITYLLRLPAIPASSVNPRRGSSSSTPGWGPILWARSRARALGFVKWGDYPQSSYWTSSGRVVPSGSDSSYRHELLPFSRTNWVLLYSTIPECYLDMLILRGKRMRRPMDDTGIYSTEPQLSRAYILMFLPYGNDCLGTAPARRNRHYNWTKAITQPQGAEVVVVATLFKADFRVRWRVRSLCQTVFHSDRLVIGRLSQPLRGWAGWWYKAFGCIVSRTNLRYWLAEHHTMWWCNMCGLH